MRAALCLLAAACGAGPRPRPAIPSDAGISIAIYRQRTGDASYAIVDDRRWIEVDGAAIVLEDIDPGASLASLVIDTGDSALRIGPCARDRLHGARVMPLVVCDVAGPSGRHLVRVGYVSSRLAYRVQHDVELRDGAPTTIDSRYAIETPRWRARGHAVLYDGMPGDAEPPRELVRGTITLDGGTSVLVTPSREIAVQVRYVLAGGASDLEDDGGEQSLVWAMLELPGVQLPRGAVRVHSLLGEDERWIERTTTGTAVGDTDRDARLPPVERVPLWVEGSLRGHRQRMVVADDGLRMTESLAFSVTNTGDAAREVIVEERARPAKKRRIERAWPAPPLARGDLLRSKLVVAPGTSGRAGYTLVYEL